MKPTSSRNRIRLNKSPEKGLSNNPPPVSLELTAGEAEFLLENCNANIRITLSALNTFDFSKTNAQAAVQMLENFKAVREKLLAQGVKENVDDG